jgi:hypothetical protein
MIVRLGLLLIFRFFRCPLGFSGAISDHSRPIPTSTALTAPKVLVLALPNTHTHTQQTHTPFCLHPLCWAVEPRLTGVSKTSLDSILIGWFSLVSWDRASLPTGYSTTTTNTLCTRDRRPKQHSSYRITVLYEYNIYNIRAKRQQRPTWRLGLASPRNRALKRRPPIPPRTPSHLFGRPPFHLSSLPLVCLFSATRKCILR